MDRGCTQTERDIALASFLQDQAQDDGVRLHVILSNPLYTDCAIIFDAMARAKKSTLHHSALVPVPGYQASKARWALQPRGQAVLFVHGFNGTSVGTWKGFDEILPLEPRARGLDLLFYGYDSWLTDIRSSGRKLFRLMQTLHTDNGSLAPPALGTARASFNGYKSILVCAHSLGGVVTRRALLHACKRDEPWAENTASILFAPAHLSISDRILVKLAASCQFPLMKCWNGSNLTSCVNRRALLKGRGFRISSHREPLSKPRLKNG
jgi:pimeloyl-ACP methyl ester carboxylesterase